MSNVEKVLLSLKEGLSCSQAIPFTYGPELDLDPETALKISSALGGGIARTGNICGAVSSAILVISLKHGHTKAEDSQAKEKTYTLVNEFMNSFSDLNGSIKCSELIGCDISTAEGIALAREKNLFLTICPKYIENAAQLMEKVL